jgi:hypothetical protein
MVVIKLFKPCRTQSVNGVVKQNTPSKACVIIPLVLTFCVAWYLIEIRRIAKKQIEKEAGGDPEHQSKADAGFIHNRPVNPSKLLVAVTLPVLVAFPLFWGYCRTCRAHQGVLYAFILLAVTYTALTLSLLPGVLLTGHTWLT